MIEFGGVAHPQPCSPISQASECLLSLDLEETSFIPLFISSLQSCVVLPRRWSLVSFLRALMWSRMLKTTDPVVTTQYRLATPSTMDVSGSFVNSDLEAPLLFGWLATSRGRETRVESSPSRQSAPTFPHPRTRARSPNWLFPKNLERLSLLPSMSPSRLSTTISSYKVQTAPTYFSFSLLLAPASLPFRTRLGELPVVDDYVQTWLGRSRNKRRWWYTTCTAPASFMEVAVLPLFQWCQLPTNDSI